jgi:cell wall-associated NlpC family hydrolase
MKNLFIAGILTALLSGCSLFRPATSPEKPVQPTRVTFIDDISSTPGSVSYHSQDAKTFAVREPVVPVGHAGGMSGYSTAQFKYAILTNSPVELMTNEKLLSFMDEWYGTQYHYGGTSKEGIDCSAFAAQLQADVYNINSLPRISRDQYSALPHVGKSDLREGDLVFFHTRGRGHAVTHVGVYLYNGRFIHASISGVMISDLTQGYYSAHYVGAARPENQ